MRLKTKNRRKIIRQNTLTLVRCSHVGACEYCVLMDVKTSSLVTILGQKHGGSTCLRNVRNFRPNKTAWRPSKRKYWSFFLILACFQHMAEFVALRSVTGAHHVFTASQKYRLMFSGMWHRIFWYQVRIHNFSLGGNLGTKYNLFDFWNYVTKIISPV